MGKKGSVAKILAKPATPAPGLPSALLDTRVACCGDNLEQLAKRNSISLVPRSINSAYGWRMETARMFTLSARARYRSIRVNHLTEATVCGKVFLREREDRSSMPFPEAARQVYERNPLAEVIAQLRFDSILLIDAEPPAQFQDRVRQGYPTYRVAATLPPGMPQQVQRMIREMGAPEPLRQYTFGSQDSLWEIILTRDSLVLKTQAYGGWEGFEERLRHVQDAFERTYRPAGSYVSVNLRYVDIIQRSRLELQNAPWCELLIPEVGGELASAQLGEDIDKMTNSLHCRLDNEGSFLTLKTSLALSKDGQREKCFVIDSDFHTHSNFSRVEAQNVQDTFRQFNLYSRYFFQWAIKDRLRAALRPIQQER